MHHQERRGVQVAGTLLQEAAADSDGQAAPILRGRRRHGHQGRDTLVSGQTDRQTDRQADGLTDRHRQTG